MREMSERIVSDLFDAQGNMKKSYDAYFDDDGDIIEDDAIGDCFMNFPADSSIVRMHFASEHACATKFGYSARDLLSRC